MALQEEKKREKVKLIQIKQGKKLSFTLNTNNQPPNVSCVCKLAIYTKPGQGILCMCEMDNRKGSTFWYFSRKKWVSVSIYNDVKSFHQK